MRDIKFRAWSGDRMITPAVWINDSNLPSYSLGSAPVAPLMQFTGLRDCNGVEIYEGDIVRDHVGIGIVKYSDKHCAFRVSYGDGLAKWFYDYYLNGERESIEVIGNIHQNPELLK